MTQSTNILPALTTLALSLATNATAEQVFSENVIVNGKLCAGTSCAAGEVFDPGSTQLKLKATGVTILMEDTGGTSDNDWRIQINDTSEDSFYIVDHTADTTPFKIMGTAPDNSLFVASNGQIGLGTTMPTTDLHLKNGPTSNIRFEAANGTDFSYLLEGNETGFYFYSQAPGIERPTAPRFLIRADAPKFAFTVDSGEVRVGSATGNYDFKIQGAPDDDSIFQEPLFFVDGTANRIGIDTEFPNAPLELSGPDAFNFFRISARGAAFNKSVDITFTQGPLGTGQLRYNIVDGDNQEMSLDSDGNVVIDGTLTTAGPTCASGCDRVFDADYALKSIEDHQAQMWTNGYLPNVGPTPEQGPFNVSDKMGRMLNELEHAHIYIGQLNTALADEKANSRRMEQKLDMLIAEVADLRQN